MRTLFLVGASCALVIAQPTAEVRRWPGVAIGDVIVANILVNGLDGAAQWLKKPECRGLFSEFHDERGRPLQEKLQELQMAEADYLSQVRFRDGSAHAACERPLTLMFTSPGSRVVFVCSEQFRRGAQRDPVMTNAVVLHEALHTLGLGENPPSSAVITHRVITRCAR